MSKLKIHTDVMLTNLENDNNLAIISDIHVDALSKRKEKYAELIKQIAQLKPDFILIPGDIIQSYKASLCNVNYLINEFGQIAPTILSLGNHELKAYRDGLTLDWFHNLVRFNQVYPLYNSSICLNNIQFTGFSPTLKTYLLNNQNNIFYDEFKQAKISFKQDTIFNIMLTHNPNFITEEILQKDSNLANYNLFISGHNHNGCVPSNMEKIFGIRGLIGPYFRPFPNCCRGLFDVYNSKLFISKGYRKITQENILSNKIDSFFSNDVHQLILKKK